jgi:hypothetical protein
MTILTAIPIDHAQIRQAHQIIRAHHNPYYVAAVDQFERACLQQMQAEPWEVLFGTDLVIGIDLLFENANSLTMLDHYTDHLLAQNPLNASDDITADSSLYDAIRTYTVLLPQLGREWITQKGAPSNLIDQWEESFRRSLHTYIRVQRKHTYIVLGGEHPLASFDFAQAALDYSTQFASTSGFGLSCSGVFGFSPFLTSESLIALEHVTTLLEPLYRLALDVAFDADEMLNAGLYAFAHEHQISLSSAHQRLIADSDLQKQIQNSLYTLYIQEAAAVQARLEVLSALYAHHNWFPMLHALTQDALTISNALTSRWKLAN